MRYGRLGPALAVMVVAVLVTSAAPAGAVRSHGILVVSGTGSERTIARVDPGTGGITPVVEGATVSSPRWSPDGRRFAWRSESEASDDPEIYVARADGKRRQQVTDDERNDFDVDWAPGSDRVVMVGWMADEAEIFVGSARGGDLRRLTHNEHNDAQPDWSPQGGLIAFTHSTDYAHFVHTARPGGGTPRRLGRGGGPQFSPDGSKILFARNGKEPWTNDLYVMRADGTDVKRLTRSDAYEDEYSWAPDGSGIAFVRTRFPSPDDFEQSLWHMRPNGRRQKRLTSGDLSEATGYLSQYFPTWSLSSHRIAYVRYSDAEGYDHGDLWVVRVDEDEMDGAQLTSEEDGPVYTPNWFTTPVELQSPID